jgi:mannose-6-phosphate isomerase
VTAAPVQLAPNPVQHFYAGGAKIAQLRGFQTTSDHQPEEWLGATVARAGDDTTGLAVTTDGTLLRDLVAADPLGWRGTGAVSTLSDDDTGLLLKLLDAGQRLPVHVHPDRAFTSSHLGCAYGKTECWFVLDAEPGAAVHLGWTEDVDPAELAERRDAQDGAWMLERMHRVEVRPGQGILVPAGQVHAIGAGVFVAEAQEPTDLSIVLEWSVTTSGREESHLGLGFDTVMDAVSHRALAPEALAALVHEPAATPGLSSVLPPAADPFFRLDLATPGGPAAVPSGFAVVLVLDGSGALEGTSRIPLNRGDSWAVPAAYGAWRVTGDATVVVARPGDGWPRTLTGDVS